MAHCGRPYDGDILPARQLDQSLGLVLRDALSNDGNRTELQEPLAGEDFDL